MALSAMRLARILCSNPFSPEHVHPMRYSFQVLRIYTWPIPAKVIRFESWRDWTLERFVACNVRPHLLAVEVNLGVAIKI